MFTKEFFEHLEERLEKAGMALHGQVEGIEFLDDPDIDLVLTNGNWVRLGAIYSGGLEDTMMTFVSRSEDGEKSLMSMPYAAIFNVVVHKGDESGPSFSFVRG